jgi:hypothetical protein
MQAVALAAVPVVVVLGMAALVPLFYPFQWLNEEDSVTEWVQFGLILSASLVFALVGLQLIRAGSRLLGVLCFFVALGAFFIAGEEIAWGQNVFGWVTPERLAEVNVQNETTLHNISTAHQAFVYGSMLVGMYGTLAPLFGLLVPASFRRCAAGYLLIPPLFLVPAFAAPFLYRFVRLAFAPELYLPHLAYAITKFSEVTELCLYFGLLVFGWLNLRRLRSAHPPHADEPPPVAEFGSPLERR